MVFKEIIFLKMVFFNSFEPDKKDRSHRMRCLIDVV
jgi:hypothetical protein